ncbi:MAG: ABC transporter ATP-binding protein, partial [Tissierellia bacterium]|nr:ABC transporter ATP-binding protein [Tissierellia bacterium]
VEVEYYRKGELFKERYSTVVEEEKNKLVEIIQTNDIQTMHTKEATLEEIFIKVTGRGLA